MRRLLPATAAAALLLSLLGSVPAMASAHHGPAASLADAAVTRQATTPDTSPAKCSSAWLRLRGSNGESCYSGNGSLVVNLPGVYYEQILCTTGPGNFGISPPATIRGINIRTPLLARYALRLFHHPRWKQGSNIVTARRTNSSCSRRRAPNCYISGSNRPWQRNPRGPARTGGANRRSEHARIQVSR
jgi:hypothetical protein